MKYTGNGTISSSDYKDVTFTGKTKGGEAVKITLKDAINLGNIDWAFADKGETVPEVTFTATYSAQELTEPWEVEKSGTGTGLDNIIVGSGVLKIGDTSLGLVRGGGQFTVERTFRNIEADGDRGPVKGRIAFDSSVATLRVNMLEILNHFVDVYPGVSTST